MGRARPDRNRYADPWGRTPIGTPIMDDHNKPPPVPTPHLTRGPAVLARPESTTQAAAKGHWPVPPFKHVSSLAGVPADRARHAGRGPGRPRATRTPPATARTGVLLRRTGSSTGARTASGRGPQQRMSEGGQHRGARPIWDVWDRAPLVSGRQWNARTMLGRAGRSFPPRPRGARRDG